MQCNTCSGRRAAVPPDVLYEDDEIVIVPALTDEELEQRVRELWNKGIRNAWEIREHLGYRAGIDRIQHVLNKLYVEERRKRYFYAYA